MLFRAEAKAQAAWPASHLSPDQWRKMLEILPHIGLLS